MFVVQFVRISPSGSQSQPFFGGSFGSLREAEAEVSRQLHEEARESGPDHSLRARIEIPRLGEIGGWRRRW